MTEFFLPKSKDDIFEVRENFNLYNLKNFNLRPLR